MKRPRHKITNATVEHDGKLFAITLKTDGLHIRARHAREEKLITLADLVARLTVPTSPTKAGAAYLPGSTAEACDIAACDLNLLSGYLHTKEPVEKVELENVHRSVAKALKIVKSLEVLS